LFLITRCRESPPAAQHDRHELRVNAVPGEAMHALGQVQPRIGARGRAGLARRAVSDGQANQFIRIG
jgi:hypothetical protein